MTTSATEVMVQIVELLTPLSTDDRQRIVRAALTLLGDIPTITAPTNEHVDIDDAGKTLSPKVRNWLKQNVLSVADLEEVFHFSDGIAEVIVSDIPGANSKEKTHNAYILTGIAQLLSRNDPSFDDKQARDLCKSLGCLNEGNHAAYMKAKGNGMTGSKEKGWTLTAPGLKQGATLVKILNKNNG